ncbi:hypothetical protein QTI51_37485 [Variovorax sp. J22G73]|uniref:hypothetical protein n=1 Tax=unclassified Variovorax TaxID=663243 RepID=UPI002574BC67|nr:MULTISPECIES: hypothetical protein [unclassified Variovorax]MDM0010122.1 hypothetical protein [Variovorax sp. J22R203]MDM0103019.1 hypothetical protein [Variovorax sp. J22G73]
MAKQKKSSNDLAGIIAERVGDMKGGRVGIPLPVQAHPIDAEGRSWDTAEPAPSPAIRSIIDAVRDEYDLGP